MNVTELAAIQKRKDLPFWLSPWRVRTVIVNGKPVVHHVMTVAASREERTERSVEIAFSDEALRSVPPQDRKKMLAEKIVEALQSLGIVKKEAQPTLQA